MTSWKTYRLGDICTLNYGKALTATNRVAGDIPVYSSAGITGSHNVALVQSKGIIVGRKGSVGTVYYSDKPFYCIDTAYYILPNDEKYDFKWLYYRLKSLHLDKLNEDSAVPGLNRETAYAQEFPLPPLEEQQRIAGILGAIDDKIENNRRINTNLELQAQALYKQWFVDFEFPNEEGKPYKSSGGKMVDSELGQIPEGWSVGNIGGYCKIRSGYAFKSSWWTDRGVKVIKIKNITENGVLDMSECSYVDIKHCDKASDFNGHAGDLIIAMTGATLGKVCIIPYHTTDYYINQRVGKFFLGDNPINKLPFIHCILRDENVMSEIINKGQGSAQPNISASDVETIKIVMPSDYIMDKFNLLLQSNYALWLKNMAEVNSFATLRDTLLPKLMNGEIKL